MIEEIVTSIDGYILLFVLVDLLSCSKSAKDERQYGVMIFDFLARFVFLLGKFYAVVLLLVENFLCV